MSSSAHLGGGQSKIAPPGMVAKEVTPEALRFDFTHTQAMTAEEIAEAFDIAREAEKSIEVYLDSNWYKQLSKTKAFLKFLFNKTPLQTLKHFPTPMKSYEFYKTLKLAEIDNFSADVSMNQFKVGYPPLPLVFGWIGAYANPENSPEDLSCNPNCYYGGKYRRRSPGCRRRLH